MAVPRLSPLKQVLEDGLTPLHTPSSAVGASCTPAGTETQGEVERNLIQLLYFWGSYMAARLGLLLPRGGGNGLAQPQRPARPLEFRSCV